MIAQKYVRPLMTSHPAEINSMDEDKQEGLVSCLAEVSLRIAVHDEEENKPRIYTA